MTLIRSWSGAKHDGKRRDGGAALQEADQRRRPIELRIISAQDLKRTKLQLGRMRAYAVVYVEEEQKVRTSVDERGGQNPVWNDVLTLSVLERQLRKDSLACLNVDIFCCGGRLLFTRDKLVGTVRIFLSDVLKDGTVHNPIHCMAFWIRLPSGEPHGILNVWVPPSGKFLRRQHDSADFSRMLSFPDHPAPAADLHVRYRFLSPARGVARPSQDTQHGDYDTEAFTFDV